MTHSVRRGDRDPAPARTPAWVARLRDAARGGASPVEQNAGEVLNLAVAVAPDAIEADRAELEPSAEESAELNQHSHGQQSPTQQSITEASRYAVFCLGPSLYAVPVEQVLEIRPAPRCTSVPNVAAFVRGVAYLRSEVVCVLDLAMLLDTESDGDEEAERLLVIQPEQGQPVGFIVDGVLDLAVLGERLVDAADDSRPSPFIQEKCRLEGQFVQVLDTAALLASDTVRGLALRDVGRR